VYLPATVALAYLTTVLPFDVIARQLLALTLVSYPHDSWVLDEGADHQVEKLARGLGARYFTRSGLPRYNKPVPPFQGSANETSHRRRCRETGMSTFSSLRS
jgi:hypothetical protein